jgi:hypothetical protein
LRALRQYKGPDAFKIEGSAPKPLVQGYQRETEYYGVRRATWPLFVLVDPVYSRRQEQRIKEVRIKEDEYLPDKDPFGNRWL